MPQGWLPLIPRGATAINEVFSVEKKNGKWFYFSGLHPVFHHDEKDLRLFRLFTAQLVASGNCRQSEIVKAFGVSKNSVNRSVKKFEKVGSEAFYKPRKGRGATVITPEVKKEVQILFGQGKSRAEVAKDLGIKYDTLKKAINQGRIILPPIIKNIETKTKSQRSQEDAEAVLGVGCTRPVERIGAALGILKGAETRFESCYDVSYGGVLCALPALIASGLLSGIDKCLKTVNGYYTTTQVLILVAYMALCRIKTTEQLQYHPPGELGKLMGLDRVPEVRCLRKKLKVLSKDDAPEKWSESLSRTWLKESPKLAGALYIDGHVRVYHGKKTKLPKRYVSRERLCLRGTTDYWVNDALGQPFFVVNRPIDHGMLEALRKDIVPRLLKDISHQPTKADLKNDPHLFRFALIFDREGYSPKFFKEMWNNHRIACITYHKFPKDKWPENCFVETEVKMPNGETLKMKIAEQGSFIGDKNNGLWVREVRKLSKNHHQTSLISTAKKSLAKNDAALLFSRWSQENFFAYMAKHYAIDILSEYETEEFPGKQQVINPAWRKLDKKRRSLKSKLSILSSRYTNLDIHPETNQKKIEKWKIKKAELVDEIEQIEHSLELLKISFKSTPKHIEWQELDETEKFFKHKPSRKHLIDTIKMIAYRAETALTNIIREKLFKANDARALVRDLFMSEADIIPSQKKQSLLVNVHSRANQRFNVAIKHLLENLNAAEFKYPGTKFKIEYSLISHHDAPKY